MVIYNQKLNLIFIKYIFFNLDHKYIKIYLVQYFHIL